MILKITADEKEGASVSNEFQSDVHEKYILTSEDFEYNTLKV